MKGLNDGDVYMHLVATAKDSLGASITIEPNKFFKVTDNAKLKMTRLADGRFKITMIPNKFLTVPAGYTLFDIEIIVRKKNYSSVADQTDKKTKFLFGCQ